MKKEDYFVSHLPHRVNLLTTFRDRYSPTRELKRGKHRRKLHPEEARDLYRCAKDISMLMVRFFCDELGLYLGQNADEIVQRSKGPRFTGIKKLTVEEAKRDPRYDRLTIVLKAANRAVAHIFPDGVDHPIKDDADSDILFEVIDWVEELIKTRIYEANGESFEEAMNHRDNNMDASFQYPTFAVTGPSC
jgi:hypothetical protein